MKDPENANRIAALAPNYLGFIFYEKSPRFVDRSIPLQNKNIRKTGVFVDASAAFIFEMVKEHELSAVQLHGKETVHFCKSLKNVFLEGGQEVDLIKVFSVGEAFDFEALKPYENEVDFFLFDTKGKNRGGNGIRFNWEIMKKYDSATPFFLSGGIGPEDLPQIKELYRFFEEQGRAKLFYAIDVNSKFEVSPGLKNEEQLSSFKRALLKEKY